jgi:hypothetical protein
MTDSKLGLPQIRKSIQKEVDPRLTLIRGKGYYYFASDDYELSLKLSSLETTSVYVYRISDLTKKQWIEEAQEIMKKVL